MIDVKMCLFQGNFVAVGTYKGYVQIWDVSANKRISVLEGHSARVGKTPQLNQNIYTNVAIIVFI